MAAVRPVPLALPGVILDRLQDGIIRLDPRGRIRGLNKAAQPWLRACITATPRITRWIQQSQEKSLALPAQVPLFKDCTQCPPESVQVWMDRDGDKGFVLVLIHEDPAAEATLPTAESPVDATSQRAEAVLDMLGDAVRQDLRALRSALGLIREEVANQPALPQKIDEAMALLGDLTDLAALHQRDEAFSEERFGLAPLLTSMIPDLPGQNGLNPIRYVYHEGVNIGQVYGRRALLRQALYTLLYQLGMQTPPGYQVRIHLRQIGDFMVVSANIAIDRTPLPPGDPDSEESIIEPPRLRMPLCLRILELHGGRLKYEYSKPGVIESFTLNLATGMPAHDRRLASCHDCRVNQQAIAYARDLAGLLENPPAPGSTTQPETDSP